MHTLGLRSALACAAVGLGALALPSHGAAAQRAYVPDEVVVGTEGEAPRVHRLAPGTTVGEAIAAFEAARAVAVSPGDQCRALIGVIAAMRIVDRIWM